jgi:hypothetical protein
MTTTFTWSIDRMSTLQEPQPNYVSEVAWTVSATHANTYYSCVGGRTTLNSSESNNFIPYEELTEEVVVAWVKSSLGEQAISEAEAKIQAYFNKQLNPPTSVPLDTPLPWAE